MSDGPAAESPLARTTQAASEQQRVTAQTLYPPTSLHAPIGVSRYFVGMMLGAIFPLTAGVALYGWRAVMVLLGVLGSTAVGIALWRRVGRRGAHLSFTQALWLGVILTLALPAHLASVDGHWFSTASLWAAIPAAGLMLAAVLWLFGGVGARVHPVVVVYLLLVAALSASLTPSYVLRRDRLVTGDLLNVDQRVLSLVSTEPWATATIDDASEAHALYRTPAAQRLSSFTRGRPDETRSWLSLDGLIRDRMPPLEDLIIGGQPNTIGSASAIAVIMGGLFLVYRGLVDFGMTLLMILSAYVALVVLPIPLSVSQDAATQMQWLALRHPGIGWSLGFTFANYELMAGPLLLVAFFLASAPGVRPMARRAQFAFAVILGIAAAAMQLYVSVAHGAYLALLFAGLLAPLLDRALRPKPLV